MRGKKGFRGESYNMQAEALFLKRPETMGTSASGLQLNKLAYMATILGRFECAQQCFEAPGFNTTPQSESSPTDPRPKYLDFISRLARAVVSLPQHSTPLYKDVYSYTLSQSRDDQIPAPPPESALKSVLRKYVKSIPPLISSIRFLRALPQRLKRLSRSTIIQARWRLNFPDSPVEALFLEFGMKQQYLLAKRNRFLDNQAQPNQRHVMGMLEDLKFH
jgi:hypothetical protein